MNKIQNKTNSFVAQIKQLIKDAQIGVSKSVNAIMVQTYFELGRRIVEQEQEGKDQADYGGFIIDRLSPMVQASRLFLKHNSVSL